jgi:hypothetical protein
MPNGEWGALQVRGEQGRLRILSEGGRPVSDVLQLLEAFASAYDGLSLAEKILEGYASTASGNSRLSRRRWLRYILKLTDHGIRRTLSVDDQLILASVELSSPGFWEFMGSLMPLEVLRQYLNDRHQRRQDRAYRERRENRQLELQNQLLENQVMRERIAIAREAGMTDQDFSQLLGRFVIEPFRQIDQVAAQGMILSSDADPLM